MRRPMNSSSEQCENGNVLNPKTFSHVLSIMSATSAHVSNTPIGRKLRLEGFGRMEQVHRMIMKTTVVFGLPRLTK